MVRYAREFLKNYKSICSRQMCWGLRVFFHVFGNLAGRIGRDLLDNCYYKMRCSSICFLCSGKKQHHHRRRHQMAAAAAAAATTSATTTAAAMAGGSGKSDGSAAVGAEALVPHENKYDISSESRKDSLLLNEAFYQQVDRLQAEHLLEYRQNGTFLLRPSGNESSLGTLSIIQDGRIFHLSVRQRKDGLVSLGSYKPNEKCFSDFNSLLNYYVSNYLLVFSDGIAYSTLLIPYREICDVENNNLN